MFKVCHCMKLSVPEDQGHAVTICTTAASRLQERKCRTSEDHSHNIHCHQNFKSRIYGTCCHFSCYVVLGRARM